METKKFKTFEIGDGLKSIKVPAKYCADIEKDHTLLLYNPDNDTTWIRITVLTIEPKDKNVENPMYEYIIEKGKKEGYNVVTISDKSYFVTKELSKENGEELTVNIFDIGYKFHYLLISATTLSENANTVDFEQSLSEISNAIPTINEVSLKKSNMFELTYSDYQNIWKRISEVFDIDENKIDEYHDKNETVEVLQEILDKEKYKPSDTFKLQSLGIALGDYIQHKYSEDYHWVIVRDEYGRDFSLQYKNYLINLFPMTMISKRVEDGEKVVIDALIDDIMNSVKDMIERGNFQESND